MDRPQQREIVYCHSCENEWYRDENGLQCPDCHSEFIEIVEGGNDPRAQEQEAAAAAAAQPANVQHPLHNHNPWDAPDPDEDDIEHFQWNRAPPGDGGQRYHATFNRTYNMGAGGQGQGQNAGAAGGGLFGMIGNIVGGLLQQPPNQQGHEHGQYGHDHSHEHAHTHAEGQGDGLNRGAAASPPGSPDRGDQAQGRPGYFTRHIHGPGYSFTMTATSGSNLSPRNANGPQPFNAQPQDMDELMQQMFSNIGAFPPLHPPGHDHVHRGANGAPVFPATLLQLLNHLAPTGGVHGDAVYSQEALDRVVSQLMEQHQTGNAPGPASESAIKSLPKRPITEKDMGDSGTADCSICMDSVPLGDTVTVLPCEHWFHHECIRAWLSEHDTCPHCRKGIMPRDTSTEGDTARNSSQAPLHDPYAQQPPPGTSSSGGGGSSSSAGVFSRMRDAFGSGARRHSSGGGGGGRSPGPGPGPGESHT